MGHHKNDAWRPAARSGASYGLAAFAHSGPSGGATSSAGSGGDGKGSGSEEDSGEWWDEAKLSESVWLAGYGVAPTMPSGISAYLTWTAQLELSSCVKSCGGLPDDNYQDSKPVHFRNYLGNLSRSSTFAMACAVWGHSA